MIDIRADEPFAEILSHFRQRQPRLVSRIKLCMYNVRSGEQYGDQIVHMCREALETGLCAHEAVNVYQQQSSPLIARLLVRQQRLHGRGPWILTSCGGPAIRVGVDGLIIRRRIEVIVGARHHV